MKKVKSTLQQNVEKSKKGKKSMILDFYHHSQNKKKESQPMADALRDMAPAGGLG